jgi:hypothetical protein
MRAAEAVFPKYAQAPQNHGSHGGVLSTLILLSDASLNVAYRVVPHSAPSSSFAYRNCGGVDE